MATKRIKLPTLYHGTACGWLDFSGFKRHNIGTGETNKPHNFVFLTTYRPGAFGLYSMNSVDKTKRRLDSGELTKSDLTYDGTYYAPARHVYTLNRLPDRSYRVINWRLTNAELSAKQWEKLHRLAGRMFWWRFWCWADWADWADWRAAVARGSRTWQHYVEFMGSYKSETGPLDKIAAVLSPEYDLVANIEVSPTYSETWALLVGNGQTYPCTKIQ
jgi:hypothetical protein